ncbi:hypothetical protein PBY51_007875 [Eleginops maclovinus]|uniref:Uncharacterized protein n=1 Tax=Eleginops maclovinus TaxID=56733 RepID=A0AAN7X8B6_ELEMC|nr:hypothetical protein PBY51_007875 [Eleginops maclovinus]
MRDAPSVSCIFCCGAGLGVGGGGLQPGSESVTVHLSERKAWLITVSWLQSEHVCWGDPQARRGRRGGHA